MDSSPGCVESRQSESWMFLVGVSSLSSVHYPRLVSADLHWILSVWGYFSSLCVNKALLLRCSACSLSWLFQVCCLQLAGTCMCFVCCAFPTRAAAEVKAPRLCCSEQEAGLDASLQSLPAAFLLSSQVGCFFFLHQALISLDSIFQFRRFVA